MVGNLLGSDYFPVLNHVSRLRVMRLIGEPDVLKEIYTALYDEFKVTVADGSRFVGMDVVYDRPNGVLTLHGNICS